MFSKRLRPPNIDLARTRDAPGPKILLERNTPADLSQTTTDDDDTEDNDDVETLQLSDSDSSDFDDATSSPNTTNASTRRSGSRLRVGGRDDDVALPEDITKDLVALQELRKSVKTNLRLRPIRSRSNLPKIDLNNVVPLPFTTTKGSEAPAVGAPAALSASTTAGGVATATAPPLSATSPTSSLYYTPISETPYTALFSAKYRTPISSLPSLIGNIARPISSRALCDCLGRPTRPLVIDTRPLAAHKTYHLRDSVNITTSALILKRKPMAVGTGGGGAGLQTFSDLRQFVSTEQGKLLWDELTKVAGGEWNGNVVLYDDELDVHDKDNSSLMPWAVVAPLLGSGCTLEYLEGGLSSHDPDLSTFIVTPNADGSSRATATATTVVTPPPLQGEFTSGTGTPQHITFLSIKNRHTPLSSPLPPLPGNIARPISAPALYSRLRAPHQPLLIDTRPLATHQAFHLRYSVSIAIPSLILKRCRKPGGGLQSLDALRQFTTTEQGKARWDALMGADGGWDGNVVIYDDEMDVKDRDNLGATAWAIMPVIAPLLSITGTIEYLEGGLSSAGHDPELGTLIITDDEMQAEAEATSGNTPQSGGFARKNSAGLFQLDTWSAGKFKKLPELEPSSSTLSNPPSPLPAVSSTILASGSTLPPPSPLPMMPSHSRTPNPHPTSINVADSTPSPPPSSVGFRRPAPPRRPSVPALRRLDTRSAERRNPSLPKLSVRTKPMRSATLTVPPSLTLNIGQGNWGAAPQSPSHLNLMYSTHSPPPGGAGAARFGAAGLGSPNVADPGNYLTAYYTPPHTPGTPRAGFGFFGSSPSGNGVGNGTGVGGGFPPSPSTARPDLDPPTTEEPFPVFTVSTILPNFLYLGPELTTEEHVKELKELGVKRVLNIAAECDDDMGLGLREAFKYFKIPMRDTVEEDGIGKGVREACDILDDARLHSAPTYVHCKAGKSRSVTAVMAYLIHANHWTLSRAYAFVLERRKGISPNIGFVSELMNLEEQELGGKSVGVHAPTSATGSATLSGAGMGTGGAGMHTGMGMGGGGGHTSSASLSIGVGNGVGMSTGTGTGQGQGRSEAGSSSSMQHAQATVQEAYAMASSSNTHHHRRGAPHLPPVGTDLSPGPGMGSAMGGAAAAPMSAGGIMDGQDAAAAAAAAAVSLRERVNGDSGQEMEIKDASGRYRHARRAPVDENTLQPMRRVSKAGLESLGLGYA